MAPCPPPGARSAPAWPWRSSKSHDGCKCRGLHDLRDPAGSRSYLNKLRAITMRCTSDGPSPMRRTRASRYQRSSGNSFDTP